MVQSRIWVYDNFHEVYHWCSEVIFCILCSFLDFVTQDIYNVWNGINNDKINEVTAFMLNILFE